MLPLAACLACRERFCPCDHSKLAKDGLDAFLAGSKSVHQQQTHLFSSALQVANTCAAQVDVILSSEELPTLSCTQVWLMTAFM